MAHKNAAHPGVSVYRRSPRTDSTVVTWIAEYRDPDTNKRVRVTLDDLGVKDATQRRLWAVLRSKTLTARRAELRAGLTGIRKPIGEAIASIGDTLRRAGLKATSLVTYRETGKLLEAWCPSLRDGKATTLDRIGRAELVTLREWLTDRFAERSPHTLNRHLRHARAILNRWRSDGWAPKLSRDIIADAMKLRRTAPLERTPLTSAELRAVLTACIHRDPTARSAAPWTAFLLLTGCRSAEPGNVRWADVDFSRRVVELRAAGTKTGRKRDIDLAVCPLLAELLAAMRARDPRGEFVFGERIQSTRQSWLRWLRRAHGAPKGFTWQRLRQTCGSYLCSAPGIYGAASAFLAAKQLGHSVAVAERHYAGVVRIDAAAKTLEAAMGVEREVEAIVSALG